MMGLPLTKSFQNLFYPILPSFVLKDGICMEELSFPINVSDPIIVHEPKGGVWK